MSDYVVDYKRINELAVRYFNDKSDEEAYSCLYMDLLTAGRIDEKFTIARPTFLVKKGKQTGTMTADHYVDIINSVLKYRNDKDTTDDSELVRITASGYNSEKGSFTNYFTHILELRKESESKNIVDVDAKTVSKLNKLKEKIFISECVERDPTIEEIMDVLKCSRDKALQSFNAVFIQSLDFSTTDDEGNETCPEYEDFSTVEEFNNTSSFENTAVAVAEYFLNMVRATQADDLSPIYSYFLLNQIKQNIYNQSLSGRGERMILLPIDTNYFFTMLDKADLELISLSNLLKSNYSKLVIDNDFSYYFKEYLILKMKALEYYTGIPDSTLNRRYNKYLDEIMSKLIDLKNA